MPTGARRPIAARCIALVAAAACAPAQRPSQEAAPGSDEIVMYRDRAVVAQRVTLDAARRGPTTRALRLPAGIEPGGVVVIDRGGLPTIALRVPDNDALSGDLALDTDADSDAEPAPGAPSGADGMTGPPADGARDNPATRAIELTADAPRPGRFTVMLAYATDRVTWDAAYTVTLTTDRDRAVVDGALAIHNTSGMALVGAVRLIDAELGTWRDPTPAQLRAALAGRSQTVRDAAARSLGVRALAAGESQIRLLVAAPRALRSVLVYDPVGTALDHAGAVPVFDPSMGAEPRPPSAVRESLELLRDRRQTRGLPGGPARLVEHRGDGAIGVLGHGRLFDPASGIAAADTLAIGTAHGVVGRRERRDWGRDDDQRRLSEEFLITLDNARPRPVEVVVREHLYRGQNWTLAYQSVPAVKEGPQQIALRATVPAGGRAKVLYVVVSTG